MRTSRIQFIVASLLFLPVLFITIINLICCPYLFENFRFPSEIVVFLLFLSLIFCFFLFMLKILSEGYRPFFVAFFVFAYLVFFEVLLFLATYQAPNIEGTLLNLCAIPISNLFKALWGASLFTVVVLFIMGIEKNKIFRSYSVLFLFSSLCPMGQEIWHKNQINEFFGNYKEGKILFMSEHSFASGCFTDPVAFVLAKKEFTKYHPGKIPRNKVADRSPNSEFMVYESAYDRDDLAKICVANKKTGKIIILAAGQSPIWVK